jgi:molybdopterin-guanine dinucleotide biosynthesis protein A
LDVSCIILAGGRSSRFGRNKIVEKIGNQSLLERVVSTLSPMNREMIIVTTQNSSLPELTFRSSVKTVYDVYPGKGSLGGLYTGLISSNSKYNLVVGCDMPFLNLRLLDYMINLADLADVVIPKTVKDMVEPLHAVYSQKCIEKIELLLKQNKLSIYELYTMVKVRYIQKSEIDRFDRKHLSFFNVNTESDLQFCTDLILKEDFKSD